ncbi:hypothetical protein N9L18_00515 [Candidatus Pacebacteria bacterium]|nr:hypothetical protein [Candidatus Paceibacterota bacterium]
MVRNETTAPYNDNDYTGLGEAEVQYQIAEKLFDTKFKHLQEKLKEQESRSTGTIIGAVVALVFLVGGLVLTTWFFIAEYNQHYLQTEKSFQYEINELRKENMEFQRSVLLQNNSSDVIKQN